jgi:two-component system sensor histidine kinase KdpD
MPGALLRYLERFAVGLAVVVCIVLFYRRLLPDNPTTVALSLLLAVLLFSAFWGLRVAVFVSFVSTVALDFYFPPRVRRLVIYDPQNWVALFTFLVTAVVAGQLAERARRRTRDANLRRAEVEKLYALSQQLLVSQSVQELVNAIPRALVENFQVAGAALVLTGSKEIYRAGQAIHDLDTVQLNLTMARGDISSDPKKGLYYAPLLLGVKPVGAIELQGATVSRETLEALGTLLAIAIERTRATEALGKAEAAREGELLKSALLDSVAHEFRTPLTAIKASVTALLQNPPGAESQRGELLEVINEEADRLNRLVGETIEMARLDAGDVQLDFAPHSMREAIDAALTEEKNLLAGRPVSVIVPDRLPPVRMDLARVTEVVRQLLDNAVKYSPAGSPISISSEQKDSMVVTYVADRGSGIDSFEQAFVFDKFYRGRNQRLEVQGTGMGLAIVKAIIQAQGGTVGVTSQVGQGSVFSFSLPVAEQNR